MTRYAASYQGIWSSTATYQMEDLVTYDGVLYSSASFNNTSNLPGPSSTYWTATETEGSTSGSGGSYTAGVTSMTVTFSGAGSQTITHNLNTLEPILAAYVLSGCSRFRLQPVSANSMKVTAMGAGSLLVQFLNATGTSSSGGESTPQTATPTFSVAGGNYSSAQSVTISCATAGATIYYTTSGVSPSTSSTVYTGPISVATSETLQAFAVASGYTPSNVTSASYTIAGTTPQTAAPTFSVPAGTYSSPQTVAITCATSGAVIYYTTNGSTPSTSSTVYSAALTISSSETLQAIAVASGSTQSTVATAQYTISVGIPANGLVEYWPMTEGTGTVASNTIVSANPLTLGAGITWASETGFASAKAAVFSGQSGTGARAAATQVDATSQFDGTGPFSISLWLLALALPASGNYQTLLSNDKIDVYFDSSGKFYFRLASGAVTGDPGLAGGEIDINPLLPLKAGTLTNLIVTYDGSGKAAGVSFYMNNSLLSMYGPNSDNFVATTNSQTPWNIGNSSAARGESPFNGPLSGVALYNRVLSSSDLSQIYSLGAP